MPISRVSWPPQRRSIHPHRAKSLTLSTIAQARKFSEFQTLAETQLKELDRGLSDCWRLVGTRAEGERLETLCRRVAEVEDKTRDVGDRLRPGEAVHVRDAITRMATKDELVICQQYYDSMGEKLEGALERCVQRSLPR